MSTVTSLALTALLLLPASTATGEDGRDEAIAAVTEKGWSESITTLADKILPLEDGITVLDTGIVPFDTRTTEGGEEVVSLSSDILFAFAKADIADPAAAKIRELAQAVPDAATVRVHGHTDALGSDELNAELSLERAEAVAAIIEEARPDLTLEIEGFGPSRPVEPNEKNGEDNPDGRAKNRRVEIRYDD